MLVTVLSVH